MEPEGSLPYSQHLAICPYRKPDRSSPYHPNIHFNIILQSTPGSSSLRFPY